MECEKREGGSPPLQSRPREAICRPPAEVGRLGLLRAKHRPELAEARPEPGAAQDQRRSGGCPKLAGVAGHCPGLRPESGHCPEPVWFPPYWGNDPATAILASPRTGPSTAIYVEISMYVRPPNGGVYLARQHLETNLISLYSTVQYSTFEVYGTSESGVNDERSDEIEDRRCVCG